MVLILLTLLKISPLKNKTKTYFLLAVVLCVWGIIGYKIISVLNPEDIEVLQQDFAVSFNPKTNTVIDTFSIKTTHRDPFLGTLSSEKKKNFKTTKNRKKITWIPISYLGVIKKGTSSQVFVLNIKGKQHLLKKGQSIDSVTLIRGSAKAVVVRYKARQKSFNITQ